MDLREWLHQAPQLQEIAQRPQPARLPQEVSPPLLLPLRRLRPTRPQVQPQQHKEARGVTTRRLVRAVLRRRPVEVLRATLDGREVLSDKELR